MPPPVKLYAPSRYREPGISNHIELLFPFWGVAAKESMPYIKDALTKYQYSKNDFALVERIEDADYVVIPYHYERLRGVNPKRLSMIIGEAERARKPLLIDGSGDVEHSINVPRSIILRLSQYRYSRKENEITVPFPAEDLVISYHGGQPAIREKSLRPSVAFAGWAGLSPSQRLKTYFKELPITLAALIDTKRGAEHKGIFFRERALRALAGSPRVDARLLARASYSGHVKTMAGPVADIRREFVENLMGADYALSIRGDANSSVRFYEALSAGRIPLFLDTACVLPLEDKLNYRDFCVFVDWRHVDKIGDALADFHEHVSSERFIDMQQKAREAFTKYLRYDAFSPHLAAELRKRLT